VVTFEEFEGSVVDSEPSTEGILLHADGQLIQLAKRKFRTGSFGYFGSDRIKIRLRMADGKVKLVPCNVICTITIVNSKGSL
jgi:hypothetical protein